MCTRAHRQPFCDRYKYKVKVFGSGAVECVVGHNKTHQVECFGRRILPICYCYPFLEALEENREHLENHVTV